MCGVAACGSGSSPSFPAVTPTATLGTGVSPSLPVLIPGPSQPGSIGQIELHHPLIATGIDPESGALIDEGNEFPAGTSQLVIAIAWSRGTVGAEITVRVSQQERLIGEITHTIVTVGAAEAAGFVTTLSNPAGLASGTYQVETAYEGQPDEALTFSVGGAPLPPVEVGQGDVTGPIPYKDPTDVLVITRAAVLRARLGDAADQVLQVASTVGVLRDLDEGGGLRDTPDKAAEFVRDLLRAGTYHYLLIVGNDDAVPFFHMPNPIAINDARDLTGWDLPADWYPSDDPYGDLDGDQWTTPDLAVARIPSSDDATLLLTQLGNNVPPDGHGFALINQKRRVAGGAVIEAMNTGFGVDVAYSPPETPDEFAAGPGQDARYLYVLMHGIGVITNTWWADIESWTPKNAADPIGEWTVEAYGPEPQRPSVVLQADIGSNGVISVGACYGAWTLDTIRAPQHKTADNSLALHFLKSGARAFVADTHISYSWALGQSPLFGRTGFETVFWKYVGSGWSPIDAFQQAKVEMSKAIDAWIQSGDAASAQYDIKTLHYMVYLGRP